MAHPAVGCGLVWGAVMSRRIMASWSGLPDRQLWTLEMQRRDYAVRICRAMIVPSGLKEIGPSQFAARAFR